MRWGSYIFVRYTFSFLAGILFYVYAEIELPHTAFAFLLLASIYTGFRYLTSPTFKRSFHPWFGAIAFAQLFLFGYWWTQVNTARNNVGHFMYQAAIEHYEGIIISEVETKARSYKATFLVKQVYSDSLGWRKANGQLLLYISQQDSAFSLTYGDRLLVHGSPSNVQPPSNPEEFDYRRYLSFHQIYQQHYLRPNDYQLLGHETPNSLMAAAYKARHFGRNLFRKFVQSEQEYAIAVALIFGIRDSLDNEIKNAYSSAGAMHVLAVSGLHVGIIYKVLLWLFGWLKRLKHAEPAFYLTILALLWGYAFLTGLSASVLRAVTMFSVIIMADWLHKKGTIYNTLAVSAFILLLANPYVIMQVGFQLSYAAVWGIVALQPRLYRLWLAPNLFLDWVWNITCVSVAAQIATFPLGLLYFHQFPTYFFLSNLFVIPGALVIVYSGIGLVAVGAVSDILGLWLGKMVQLMIWLLNQVVFMVEAIPGSLLSGFHIEVWETWLWYVVIIGFSLLMVQRKFRYVMWLLAAGTLLGCYQTAESWEQSQQQRVTVYNIKGSPNIAFTSGMKTLFTADEALLEDTERLRFHVWQSLWSRGSKENHFVSFDSLNTHLTAEIKGLHGKNMNGNHLYFWQGKSFLILQEKTTHVPLVSVDYLILSKNAVKSLAVIKNTKAKTIIADASNTRFYVNRWQTEATELGLIFYNIEQQGAFQLSLNPPSL